VNSFLRYDIEGFHLGGKVGDVGLNDLLHLLLNLLGQDTTTELLEEGLVLRLELLNAELLACSWQKRAGSLQGLLPSGDLVGLDFVEETVDTGVDQWGHDLGRHTVRSANTHCRIVQETYGEYWGCLRSSVRRAPRLRRYRVEASKSEPN